MPRLVKWLLCVAAALAVSMLVGCLLDLLLPTDAAYVLSGLFGLVLGWLAAEVAQTWTRA